MKGPSFGRRTKDGNWRERFRSTILAAQTIFVLVLLYAPLILALRFSSPHFLWVYVGYVSFLISEVNTSRWQVSQNSRKIKSKRIKKKSKFLSSDKSVANVHEEQNAKDDWSIEAAADLYERSFEPTSYPKNRLWKLYQRISMLLQFGKLRSPRNREPAPLQASARSTTSPQSEGRQATPPKMAMWMVTWFLPDEDREEELSIHAEKFFSNVEVVGPSIATALFWRNAVTSTAPYFSTWISRKIKK